MPSTTTFILRTTALLSIMTLVMVNAPQAQEPQEEVAKPATPAPQFTGYKAPEKSALLAEDVEPRPMLVAMRSVGDGLRDTWSRRTTQELGTTTIPMQFERFYQKDLVARLMEDFREGYVQVFVEVPEMLQMTAVEMATARSATDFNRITMETLQAQLDQTNMVEDARVEVLSEGDIEVVGLDAAWEKRYDLVLEGMPPSRFYTLFGITGRLMLNITFLQAEVENIEARKILGDLAAAIQASTGSGTQKK